MYAFASPQKGISCFYPYAKYVGIMTYLKTDLHQRTSCSLFHSWPEEKHKLPRHQKEGDTLKNTLKDKPKRGGGPQIEQTKT